MRITALALLLVACGSGADDTSVADTDTDATTDPTNGTDPTDDPTDPTGLTDPTDPPLGDYWIEATGTVNGEAVDIVCTSDEQDQLAGDQVTDGVDRYLTGACVDMDGDPPYNVSLGAFANAATSSNVCAYPGLAAQVVDLTTGASFNCAVEPAQTFGMQIDEYTVEADQTVIWGGTFQLRGASGVTALQVDLTGTFRLRSPCSQGC